MKPENEDETIKKFLEAIKNRDLDNKTKAPVFSSNLIKNITKEALEEIYREENKEKNFQISKEALSQILKVSELFSSELVARSVLKCNEDKKMYVTNDHIIEALKSKDYYDVFLTIINEDFKSE
eukprot:GAHX01001944.1.p1 GENE.GAHX01001944.1~~GAHX01001944.1.p1  ORF type:complete len:124 (-),score=38.89 GAHX01001944.1:143-514(-)